MRCYACNEELSDYEATRKSKTTGEYLDLCDEYFSTVEDIFIDIEDNKNMQELLENQEDLHDESIFIP